jgi:hypothetical protein
MLKLRVRVDPEKAGLVERKFPHHERLTAANSG